MRRLVLMSLLGLALLGATAARAGAQGHAFSFAFTAFGIELPEGVTTLREPYGEDDIYTFMRGSNALMHVYVGDHPLDTVFEEHWQYVTTGTVNQQPERTIIYLYPDGTESRETIVTLGNNAWPRFAHAWYLNLAPSDAAAADRIISSIGPLRTRLAGDRSSHGVSESWGPPGSWGAQAQKLLHQSSTPK